MFTVNLWILPPAFLGLVISLYIYIWKKNNKKLVCIVGEDCDKVVHSGYSKMLGINNELWGVLYYIVVIAVGAASMYGIILVFDISLALVLFLVSLPAAVFSVILTLIQIVKLKEYCEYCLAVNAINIIIFAIAVFEVL